MLTWLGLKPPGATIGLAVAAMKKQVQNSDVVTSKIRFTLPPRVTFICTYMWLCYLYLYTLSIDADKKITTLYFCNNFQLVTRSPFFACLSIRDNKNKVGNLLNRALKKSRVSAIHFYFLGAIHDSDYARNHERNS